MNDADLYHRTNELQRRDAEDVVKEYIYRIRWRKDNRDRILDIGCGDGNVMVDILAKQIPINYEKITGIDVSQKMIKYAKVLYGNSKTEFEVMDISKPNPDYFEKFDHIFSFNCLQWVQDQQTAMKNVYNMLKKGGDCVLSFGNKNLIYDVYQKMANTPKWQPYMSDVKMFIPIYQDLTNPQEELRKYLTSAGFDNVTVDYAPKTYYFKGVDVLKKALFAVNPFIQRIPKSMHDEYFDDYMKHVRDFGLIEDNNNLDDSPRIKTPYNLLTAYVVKF